MMFHRVQLAMSGIPNHIVSGDRRYCISNCILSRPRRPLHVKVKWHFFKWTNKTIGARKTKLSHR